MLRVFIVIAIFLVLSLTACSPKTKKIKPFSREGGGAFGRESGLSGENIGEEGLRLVSQLVLSYDFKLLGKNEGDEKGSKNVGLTLTSDTTNEYDRLKSITQVHDPSLAFFDVMRELVCLFSKGGGLVKPSLRPNQ